MINISPVGRNASVAERNAFEKYDLEHKIREKFIAVLKEEFKDLDLTCVFLAPYSHFQDCANTFLKTAIRLVVKSLLTSFQLVGTRHTAFVTSRQKPKHQVALSIALFISLVTNATRVEMILRFMRIIGQLVTL